MSDDTAGAPKGVVLFLFSLSHSQQCAIPATFLPELYLSDSAVSRLVAKLTKNRHCRKKWIFLCHGSFLIVEPVVWERWKDQGIGGSSLSAMIWLF